MGRTSGAEKLRSSARNDFFDSIDPIETSAAFQRARYDYVLTDVVRGHLHLQIPKQILSVFLLRNFVLYPTNAVRPV
jgi:hypothetical protein